MYFTTVLKFLSNELHLTLIAFLFNAFVVLFISVTILSNCSSCCCKRKRRSKKHRGKKKKRGKKYETSTTENEDEEEDDDYYKEKGNGGKPQLAGTKDPNYQTLANIGQDIFDAKLDLNPKIIKDDDIAKKPKVGGMAGTADPNYQTLAGVSGDVFAKETKEENDGSYKTASVVKPEPKKPNKTGKAGTNDPNYQTLAGISADVFAK